MFTYTPLTDEQELDLARYLHGPTFGSMAHEPAVIVNNQIRGASVTADEFDILRHQREHKKYVEKQAKRRAKEANVKNHKTIDPSVPFWIVPFL